MSNVSGIIKSIQDIMRKDVGVDGDAQRISQLVWMFFLKIFDDREQERLQLPGALNADPVFQRRLLAGRRDRVQSRQQRQEEQQGAVNWSHGQGWG